MLTRKQEERLEAGDWRGRTKGKGLRWPTAWGLPPPPFVPFASFAWFAVEKTSVHNESHQSHE
jgi:hypothetical protein